MTLKKVDIAVLEAMKELGGAVTAKQVAPIVGFCPGASFKRLHEKGMIKKVRRVPGHATWMWSL